MKLAFLFVVAFAGLADIAAAEPLVFEGTEGAGKGKHIVFLAGDHEYRSEESLPALARLLARHHGFKCTVLFNIDPETGEIVAGTPSNMPGMEVLETADLAVVFLRFQNLPVEQMKHFDGYLRRGGPVVGLRTSTHGLRIPADQEFAKYSFAGKVAGYELGFGHQVLGQTWVGHYGRNHQQSTRISIVDAMSGHPILRGVKDVWVHAGAYVGEPIDGDILTMAQPLDGMTPDSPVSTSQPPMPSEWTRMYRSDAGKEGRVFTTLYGTSEDVTNEGYRRMIVNGIFWAIGLEEAITPDMNVAFVGPFQPNTFGNQTHARGIKPEMYTGFESPIPAHNNITKPVRTKTAGQRPTAKKPAAKKPAKNNAPNTTFEHRFSDDLKQTANSETRLGKWYHDAKFGAFIHFGVYSALEGEYKGRGSQHRYSEWIQVSGKIPADEYHQVAAKFNPAEFDAEAWAKVFKDSGIRYVVITSKHHDGFALFKSMVSDYNIVDYTPFKRDIIKELSEACHRNGLKFGVYYSQAQDWDEPDAPFIAPRQEGNRAVIHPDLPADFEPDMDRYIAKKSLPQVEELMKNYEIDLVWFDTPSGMNLERVKLFSDMVRKHSPDCLINSRIVHKGKGVVEAQYLPFYDYCSIGDKEVPTRKLPLYVESPDSVSSSFGYKTKGEYYYHSEKEMIDRFVRTVCVGGNYLLNNGPMGNGQLDPEAIRLYGVIGDWLRVNGESIYGTRRNPLPMRPEWGDCSVSKDGKSLYLHILEWPASGTITVNDLPAAASSAVFLANGEKADFVQEGAALKITLPAKPLNEYDTVVRVMFNNAFSE